MYKYILYSLPRFYLYTAFSLIAVVLLAFAARFLLHDFLILPQNTSQEMLPTLEGERAAYVVTYQLPNGEEQTLAYEHTPEAVLENAASAPTEELLKVPLADYGETFETTTNEQLALILALGNMLQRDLPLMMLELQQLGLSGDFETAIAGLPVLHAALADARTANDQVGTKTDELAAVVEHDTLTPEIATALNAYREASYALTGEIEKLLNLYDVVYGNDRIKSIQLPSQEEIHLAEELARSVSNAFEAHAAALKVFLEVSV